MLKILAIDDNINQLLIIEKLVKRHFKTCVFLQALNGYEGYEMAINEMPDIILLDILMPDIDGFETCSKIKSNKQTEKIPVVFLSAVKSDPENQTKILESGANAFLLKPVNELELLLQIKAMKAISEAQKIKEKELERLEKLVNVQTTELTSQQEKNIQTENLLLEKDKMYQSLVEGSPDILYVYSTIKGGTFWSNRVKEVLQYTEDDLKENPFIWIQSIAEKDREMVIQAIENVKNGKCYDIEYKIKDKTGNWHWFRDRCITMKQNGDEFIIQGLASDITKEKRNEEILNARVWLNEIINSSNENEYLKLFLDKIEELTQSEIGFFHFVEEDQLNLSLQIWSSNTLAKICKTKPSSSHYSIDQAGVWVDCVYEKKPVIHNNYATLIHKKGLPDGHAPIVRELVVPIIRKNKTVAIFGNGNKTSDYLQTDVELVQKLAEIAWDILIQKSDSRKFELLFDMSPEGIFLMDKDGFILQVNNSLYEIIGYSGASPIGKNILHLNIFKQKQREDFVENIRDFSSGKENGPFYFKLEREDGKRIDVEVILRLIEIAGKGAILGIVRDISKIVQASEKQKRTNHFLTAVIENIPGSIWIVDQNLRMVMCNSIFKNQYNKAFNTEITVGDYILKHVSGDEEEKWRLLYTRAINGESFKIEHKRKYTEVESWNEYLFAPVLLGNNEKNLALILSLDITDRIKTKNRIEENEQKLQELNATKDKFFSIIAHDLKSPFNSILGFSDLIQESVSNNDYDQIALMSKMLNKAARQSYDLLNNLLEWSRTQRGKSEFNPLYYPLTDIINSTVNVLSLTANQKNIKINIEIDEVMVFADYNMIESIIRNLISNAIKYTYENGEIVIRALEKEHEIEIAVIDNGMGMKKDIQDKLFNIGEDVVSFGTNNEKGTGLGLLLCKEFVKAHKGKIWFNSEPELGTTFFVSLPKNSNK